MSHFEKGEHRRSYVYEPMWVFAGVAVPLLYCAGAFDFFEEVWVGIVQLVFRMERTQTHARAHTETMLAAATRRKTLKYSCYRTSGATTPIAYGVIQVYSSSRQRRKDGKKKRKLKLHLSS